MTVKKCPPFIDAMTFGFLIPLVTDLPSRNERSLEPRFPSGPSPLPASPLISMTAAR